MKTFLSILAFFALSASAFAASNLDLTGTYTLTGNGGFLVYDLSFNPDRSVMLDQKTMDGSPLACHGVYLLNEKTQNLVAVYNCPAGQVLMQRMSLNGLTNSDLQNGVKVQVEIKSTHGQPATVEMVFKRK